MKTPLLVTAGIIYDEDSIGLIKRGREPFKNCWGFPGGIGAFEHVSDPKEAVQYEIKADLNCEYLLEDFLMHSYSEFTSPTVTLFYYGKIKGDIKLDVDIADFNFFSINKALKMDLAFDHNTVLEEFVRVKYGRQK
ncbi:NUDIX hydrolase [Candidatus Pacearchaeota archaeon]|nr:NUDIX hydrolase [Candidatus Pacearchaeota archaeon]